MVKSKNISKFYMYVIRACGIAIINYYIVQSLRLFYVHFKNIIYVHKLKIDN